jgi:hypothetical protein
VRLLERAGSAGEAVRLSDLLPDDAPPGLRAAAAGIELGAVPRLGSRRAFRGEQIAASLSSSPLLDQISIPERVTVRHAGGLATKELVQSAIAGFLEERGWTETGSLDLHQMQWPQETISPGPSPNLEVAGVSWDASRGTVQFVLRCRRQERCGSFLVRVPVAPEMADAWRKKLGNGISRVRGKLTAGGEGWPVLTRAGGRCRFSLENRAVRISMPVVCLQRGTLGQIIRVRDAANHQVFLGKIVGAGKVRSTF